MKAPPQAFTQQQNIKMKKIRRFLSSVLRPEGFSTYQILVQKCPKYGLKIKILKKSPRDLPKL